MLRTIGRSMLRRRYLGGNREADGSSASSGHRQPEEEEMSAVTTSYDQPAHTRAHWHPALRPILTGGAAFDAAMGVFCLVDAGRIGGWLSISSGAVRSIGVVFLVAAVAGVETLVMPRLGIRWVVGANLLFALWCLGGIAFDGPDGIGAAVLAVAVASSAATAFVEARLARG
jgi:hypothetical protein